MASAVGYRAKLFPELVLSAVDRFRAVLTGPFHRGAPADRNPPGSPRRVGERLAASSHRHVPERLVARSTAPLDAIVVPSARGAANLRRAAITARRAGAPLVVLCSRSTRADDVVRMLRGRCLAVDVDESIVSPCAGLATSTHPMNTSSDLSVKRNLALALARMLNWRTMMFVDDDVTALGARELDRTRAMLEGSSPSGRVYDVVGWGFLEFLDTSIVGHGLKISGSPPDLFLGGGALALRCIPSLPFFPKIYNEDWMFGLEAMRHGRSAVGFAGVLRQDPYDPFCDVGRAAAQEFGEILAQGLFDVPDDHSLSQRSLSEEYWQPIVDRRGVRLRDAAERLRALGHPVGAACLLAAADEHRDDWSRLLAGYVALYRRDVMEWQRRLSRLPRVDDFGSAVAVLRAGQDVVGGTALGGHVGGDVAEGRE